MLPVDGEGLLLLRAEAPGPLLLLGGGCRGGGPQCRGAAGCQTEELGSSVHCHNVASKSSSVPNSASRH